MMFYLLKSSLLLAVLYGGFALLLSRETFHRLNRLALLSVLVASMVLPLIRLTMQKPEFLDFKETELAMPEMTPEVKNGGIANPYIQSGRIANPTEQKGQTEQTGQTIANPTQEDCFVVGEAVYLLGLLVSLAIFFVELYRLFHEIKGGVHTKDELGNTVVIHGGDFAPFSFLHYIIISASDYEHLRRPILAHEQAHIRLGHTWDLLLLEAAKAVQWFNPFVYLLGRDLKAVHEYEADDAVLSFGIDAKTYQLLLVTKAVGSRLQTVCNNLSHHSLKKRIKMMHTHKSNRWLMGKALILPALMALALVSWAKPALSSSHGTERSTAPRIEEVDVTQKDAGQMMLKAFIIPNDAPDKLKKLGPGIQVTWLKGTWVEKDDGSFVEEHPVCTYPWLFRQKDYTIMLDGKPLDVGNLPDLPASALKKMEISFKNHSVNLITKPVQIPAGVKGNINPELTILLTGTPPKDSGAKTTIWERRGNFDGFSWKNYTICSWKWDVDDISVHLKEVAIRKDHSVRINVCRGVPQEHIDRITRLMKENGITNYRFVRQ